MRTARSKLSITVFAIAAIIWLYLGYRTWSGDVHLAAFLAGTPVVFLIVAGMSVKWLSRSKSGFENGSRE